MCGYILWILQNVSEEENEDIALILSRTTVDKKEMSPQNICEIILDLLLEICLQDLDQISPSKGWCNQLDHFLVWISRV
jgi:hypothetical protein